VPEALIRLTLVLPLRDTVSESGERSRFSTEAISMRYTSSDRLHRREQRVHSVTANRGNRIRPDEPTIYHPARLNYLLKLLQREMSAEN
jgi:hypothetical protein